MSHKLTDKIASQFFVAKIPSQVFGQVILYKNFHTSLSAEMCTHEPFFEKGRRLNMTSIDEQTFAQEQSLELNYHIDHPEKFKDKHLLTLQQKEVVEL